jgi:hypothetical protein
MLYIRLLQGGGHSFLRLFFYIRVYILADRFKLWCIHGYRIYDNKTSALGLAGCAGVDWPFAPNEAASTKIRNRVFIARRFNCNAMYLIDSEMSKRSAAY